MSRLPDILEELAEADAVAGELRRMKELDPADAVLAVNLHAVARRRSDLERDLGDLLAGSQMDLIRYRVEQFDGSDPPALAAARSVVLFQMLFTAIFDGIRHGPKRLYQPTPESTRLSALVFAQPPPPGEAMSLAIPNDRLLALESDVDRALGLLFELIEARARTLLREIGGRCGIAAVAAAHAWADHAVEHGITHAIGWRQRHRAVLTVTVPHSEALLLRSAISAVTDEAVEPQAHECELAAIDESERTFRIVLADRTTIAGRLDESFPLGARRANRHWYVADLLRASRVHYATGTETVRWSLRGLAPAG